MPAELTIISSKFPILFRCFPVFDSWSDSSIWSESLIWSYLKQETNSELSRVHQISCISAMKAPDNISFSFPTFIITLRTYFLQYHTISVQYTKLHTIETHLHCDEISNAIRKDILMIVKSFACASSILLISAIQLNDCWFCTIWANNGN